MTNISIRNLMVLIRFIFLWFIFQTQNAFSHPVIYKGGNVLSSTNMENYSDNQFLHSFSPRWSVGLNHLRFSRASSHTEFGLIRVNHLLWRKNAFDYQANIYLLSGFGVVDSEIEEKKSEASFLAGIEADWETRFLFGSIKSLFLYSPEVTDLSMSQLRFGFSPFESDFEDLQSWFMLQFMSMPEVSPTLMITPMLRFFFRNVLWEFGSTTRGDWMLNLMVHF